MMKTTVGEMKSGILLMFDDEEEGGWTKTIRLTWHEAAGLKHALDEVLTSPSYRERDPKSKSKEVRIRETG